MIDPQEMKGKLWKAIDSERTMMLGVDGHEDGHARPMTAQIEGEQSPLWFFSSRDCSIVQLMGGECRAIATVTTKGHDLFASIRGRLSISNDRAVIERLWNPFVASWYEGGKDDPKLVLLRLDAESAEIWENASSLLAGAKMLLGIDPKEDFKDKATEVKLN